MRLAHFSFDILLWAVHAEQMHVFAAAADHAVEWKLSKAALALAHLVVHFGLLKIDLFHLLCLFHFAPLGWPGQYRTSYMC
jgi:hypothetical protein